MSYINQIKKLKLEIAELSKKIDNSEEFLLNIKAGICAQIKHKEEAIIFLATNN